VSHTPAHDARAPELSAADFRKISELAHRKFGLSLKTGKEGLVAARLGKKIRQGGFRSFADYHRHILSDQTGQALVELIDALTTNHTCFLRERAHFDFLGQIAAGEFSSLTDLRVWSAACSSGEEPYSLAMYLSEIGQKAACRWISKLHIVATDISTRVLAKSERAVYEAERFSGIPEQWWKKYLLRGRGGCEGFYQVKPEIRRLVEFERLNLIEPLPRRVFHVIFCRNVMMYFDKPTQQDIVSRLADCLEPGGYLFVGHSETLTGIDHSLHYVKPAVYRRQPGGGAARSRG